MTREMEDGFYWVKLNEDSSWEIGLFQNYDYLNRGAWTFPGEQDRYDGTDFFEIDERRIERDE